MKLIVAFRNFANAPKKIALYPHSELIYSLWLLQTKAVIYLNSFKGFVFQMEEGCVLYEVRNEGHTTFFLLPKSPVWTNQDPELRRDIR